MDCTVRGDTKSRTRLSDFHFHFLVEVAQSCLILCDPMSDSIQTRDLPDPGIEPGSPALQVDSLPTELSGEPSLSQRVSPKLRVL